MDPIGLGLEGFDHLGRTRDAEAGRPVDRSGLLTGTDQDGPFDGLKGLAGKLVKSRTANRCFVHSSFEYWLGRTLDAGDECSVDYALDAFGRSGGDLVALLQALFASPSFQTKANVGLTP
jgi:hypothetical protein